MTEQFPISCISCRRKKIKCNKFKPCNQCKKRNIICQFPSTFRNIEINQEENGSSVSSESSGNDEDLSQLINKLKSDNNELLQANYRLTEKNKHLNSSLSKMNVDQSYHYKGDEEGGNSQDDAETYKVSGETSELGKKFYGPQSSSFMIETLKNNSNIYSQYPKNYLDKDNERLEKSLIKKELPKLKPGISNKENSQLIYELVIFFFTNYSSNFYKTFVSKISIVKFLNGYEEIENNKWENDDDLLLLTMILLISVIRLTPVEFIKIFGIEQKNYGNELARLKQNLFVGFEKLRHNLINESILTIQSYILCTEYYFIEQKYEECWSRMFHTCSIAYSIGLHVTGKLKDNELSLINNSILNSDEKEDLPNKEEKEDEKEDILKLRVWFGLRILSDKVCSILGRPNPISIQVNSLVLKYNKNYNNINLNGRNTSILLKIGLSECIRLSNMMLIENFMIDFTMSDLLKLNSKFEVEIEMLENYFQELEMNEKSIPDRSSDKDSDDDNSKELSYDELNQLPLKIAKINIINDLTVFYINKAKLFEPFILKFNKNNNDAILILKNLSNSIINFLKLIYKFLKTFEIKLIKKDINYLKIGKYFRINFPFLNSFIYQGIVIIFTLLNYKFKDFIGLKYNDKFDNLQFLNSLKTELHNLINVDSNFNDKIWSINILYLINKNLEIIDLILKQNNDIYQYQFIPQSPNFAYNEFIYNDTILPQGYISPMQQPQPQVPTNLNPSQGQGPASQEGQGQSQEMFDIDNSFTNSVFNSNDLININLSDPFWITNPDNLPYYLSSPNEEIQKQAEEELKNKSRRVKEEWETTKKPKYD
ncbi:hypothetical protein CLIB1444_14S00320 [[Candida] jaroonii]|uniref:Uncharacterized protein n=1 Tax=[Candida] jaroonii TaxID=467808 RepID=A0ACA9YED5_9ASCO|nr:hypothetical protein CLIB1444_14S00320 [[Candida] jaroonii]